MRKDKRKRVETGEHRQMSELDNALDRLGSAVSKLIAATGQGRTGKGADDKTAALIAKLAGERDRLQAEVDQLRASRDDDARLRAEAADAVKIALTDLRSLVAAQDAVKKKAG
jgi:hypothetical protein